MTHHHEVGALVRSEAHPEWGVGQIQSVVGQRVTVNFEQAGKVVLTGDAARLTPVRPDWL